jgi:hypothetical protein
MAGKYLGLGTVLKVDENDDGLLHTAITLAVDATPPARKRVRIDGTTLDATLSTYELGMEDFSEFSFNHLWDPLDAQHVSFDTLFVAKTVVEYQIVYTSGETDEFEGYVSALEPATITKDGLLSRKVTVQRKSDITRT